MSDIYFDSRQLPRSKNAYVAFLDIMGTKAHMAHSVHETANYIFKLHAAVLSAWRSEKYKNVFVYPVMDGAYITASHQEDMEKLLARIFDSLAILFLNESDPSKRFVVQAGLSYGKTIHGHTVPYSASKVYELDLGYKNNILLGPAMIQAYEAGSVASPFGISMADSTIKHDHDNSKAYGSFLSEWKWHTCEKIRISTDANELSKELIAYFNAFKSEEHPLHYDPLRIECHINRIKDYFSVDEAL